MTIVCFVDFDFPKRCGTWAIEHIVAAVVDFPIRTCVDSSVMDIEPCDVVLGLENSFYNVAGPTLVAGPALVVGPTYNSSGIGAVVDTQSIGKITGWEFLLPFSWQVWLVFAGCAFAAFGSQLLMRWLDFRRKKTSPAYVITEDEEKAFDLVMASFTALINATRLYTYYQGPYFRHVASMVMAIFSVFFVSMYSSNLTAFMFPSSVTSLDVGTYDVHWSLLDHVDSLVPVGSIVNAVNSSAPTGIIAPIAWLNCTAGTFVPLGGMVVYSVLYNKGYAAHEKTSKRIAARLAIETWPLPTCASNDPTATKLQFRNVWGLFAFAAVGYVASVAMMLIRGPREFVWFVGKSPIVNENDTLETNASTRPCRRSEDTARVDMFELSRSMSTNM